ncbi:hypothetical protein APED_06900 [Acanthopleuribacter pedis]
MATMRNSFGNSGSGHLNIWQSEIDELDGLFHRSKPFDQFEISTAGEGGFKGEIDP